MYANQLRLQSFGISLTSQSDPCGDVQLRRHGRRVFSAPIMQNVVAKPWFFVVSLSGCRGNEKLQLKEAIFDSANHFGGTSDGGRYWWSRADRVHCGPAVWNCRTFRGYKKLFAYVKLTAGKKCNKVS